MSGPADVLVIGDGDLAVAREQVDRRLRERGVSVVQAIDATSWCDAADHLPVLIVESDPTSVVISLRANGDCPNGVIAAVSAIGERRAVLVVQPGVGRQDDAVRTLIAEQAEANIVVADPSRLLGGDEAPTVATCQWWDDCAPDGTVQIRYDSGALTPAGAERLARVITSLAI
jgi:hypothetical protein